MRKTFRNSILFLLISLIIVVLLPLIALDFPLITGLVNFSPLFFQVIIFTFMIVSSLIMSSIVIYRVRSVFVEIILAVIIMVLGIVRVFIDPFIRYSIVIDGLHAYINNDVVADVLLLVIILFYTGYILLDVTRIIEKRSLETIYRRRREIEHYMREN